jgi:nitroreductase
MTTTPHSTNLLLDAIRTRRSFSLAEVSPEPIDLAPIRVMLEAANWAPNHGKTEPWRFAVFAGEGRAALGEAFGEAYRRLTPPERQTEAGEAAQRNRVWQAPVWISLEMVPALNESGTARMPEWEELIALGCAAYIVHLVGASFGLACKWTSGAVVTHPYVAEFLGLQPPARLAGFLYVGRPAVAWPEGRRSPANDKVRWFVGDQEV